MKQMTKLEPPEIIVVDADTQEKIDIVKTRLIRDYGYNDESATDVLQYVASIFAIPLTPHFSPRWGGGVCHAN